MMYLIVGRSGTGKDTLREALEKKGWTSVKSRTTRPPRNETEDTHVFLTEEEADAMWDHAVATTTINGYRYFATDEDIETSDIYIIDPRGVEELTTNLPNMAFAVVYLNSDEDSRRIMAIRRSDNPLKERDVFDARNKSESDMFEDFEKTLRQAFDTVENGVLTNENFGMKPNVIYIAEYTNDYQQKTMDDIVRKIMTQKTRHENVKRIIMEAANHDIITIDDDNMIDAMGTDGTPKKMSLDVAAAALVSDPGLFGQITLELLKSETLEDALK